MRSVIMPPSARISTSTELTSDRKVKKHQVSRDKSQVPKRARSCTSTRTMRARAGGKKIIFIPRSITERVSRISCLRIAIFCVRFCVPCYLSIPLRMKRARTSDRPPLSSPCPLPATPLSDRAANQSRKKISRDPICRVGLRWETETRILNVNSDAVNYCSTPAEISAPK